MTDNNRPPQRTASRPKPTPVAPGAVDGPGLTYLAALPSCLAKCGPNKPKDAVRLALGVEDAYAEVMAERAAAKEE